MASMNTMPNQPMNGLGLLANGSSRRWDLAVEESLDGDQWFLELDGHQVYLVFQLHDLAVVGSMLRFLEADGHKGKEAALNLGRFGEAPVSLLRDNEDIKRFFLVLGPTAQTALRLSLDAEDIQALIEALRQVLAGLPETVGS
jgi:hypothetical protein